MAGPLIGLAIRAVAGLAGKKYAKGAAPRKPSSLSEAGKDLKDINKGLKKLKEDMQTGVKEQKKRQDEALKQANKSAEKLAKKPTASYASGPKTIQ